MIVKKEQIEQEKEKIRYASARLRESVLLFNETLDSVQEVIEGLQIVANTNGGHSRSDQISRIANMEIDKKKILSIADSSDNIVVTDNMRKEYL